MVQEHTCAIPREWAERRRSDSKNGAQTGWRWWWETSELGPACYVENRLGQARYGQESCRNERMDLRRCAIKVGGRCTHHVCLATGMGSCTHMAIARHLFAASHLSLRHRSVGQTSKDRERRQYEQQRETDEHGTATCHHFRCYLSTVIRCNRQNRSPSRFRETTIKVAQRSMGIMLT